MSEWIEDLIDRATEKKAELVRCEQLISFSQWWSETRTAIDEDVRDFNKQSRVSELLADGDRVSIKAITDGFVVANSHFPGIAVWVTNLGDRVKMITKTQKEGQDPKETPPVMWHVKKDSGYIYLPGYKQRLNSPEDVSKYILTTIVTGLIAEG